MRFVLVDFTEIRSEVERHLATLPSPIDSFFEEHILASRHYRIILSGERAGFASIHHESTITQFALDESFGQHGQAAFSRLRRLEQVQSALVPTCDEFFLAHALDDYRQLAKQAYFFSVARSARDRITEGQVGLREARPEDQAFIEQHAGDFFSSIERQIEARTLFLVDSQGACVGFGVLERSTLHHNVASIGMYTIEAFRRSGVATATIRRLIEECRSRGLQPVAGCWYYNHASKKTLERAGMFSQTRLLKVDY